MGWLDTVFNIKSKEQVGFQSSPPVILSLFRVLSHAVKIFKQMLLHTALLTRMLSIIILIVIPSIPKAVSSFPNILFSTTLTGQKINQAVIVTG